MHITHGKGSPRTASAAPREGPSDSSHRIRAPRPFGREMRAQRARRHASAAYAARSACANIPARACTHAEAIPSSSPVPRNGESKELKTSCSWAAKGVPQPPSRLLCCSQQATRVPREAGNDGKNAMPYGSGSCDFSMDVDRMTHVAEMHRALRNPLRFCPSIWSGLARDMLESPADRRSHCRVTVHSKEPVGAGI